MLLKSYIKQLLITEISQDEYQKIRDYMDKLSPEDLQFNNLFDDKLRLIIPFPVQLKGIIAEIEKFFQKNDWEIDFTNGTAERKVSKVIEKGIKKGEKIEKIEKYRIGKILKFLDDLKRKIEARSPKAEVAVKKFNNLFPHDDFEGFWWLGEKNPEKWLSFWNKESEKYIGNPDALESSKFSVILSRNYTDVLKMSDFDGISSCHSEGGAYFHCARAEAKNKGLIAYVVKNEDLKNVENLQAEEIFLDKQRRIEGIAPVARLRLRRFQIKKEDEKDYDLAIPERKFYGQKIPSFYNIVRDFIYNKQKHLFKNNMPDFDLRDVVRLGASYADNKDGLLFQRFFKDDNFNEHINAEQDPEGEEEEVDGRWEEYETAQADIQAEADRHLNNIYVYSNVDDNGEGEPYISFSAGMDFRFADEDVKEEYLKDIYGRWRWDLIEKFRKTGLYDFGNFDFDYDTYNGKFLVRGQIEPEEYDWTPEGFEDFVEWIKSDVDDQYRVYFKKVRDALREFGIFKEETAMNKIFDKLEKNDFRNFVVEFNDEGNYEIGVKDKIVLTKIPEEIKIFEENQGSIGSEFYKEFYNLMKNEINKARKFASRQLALAGIGEEQKYIEFSMPDANFHIRLRRPYAFEGKGVLFDLVFSIESDAREVQVAKLVEMADYMDANFGRIIQIGGNLLGRLLRKYAS